MTGTPCLKLPNTRTEAEVRELLNRPKPDPKDKSGVLLPVYRAIGGRTA